MDRNQQVVERTRTIFAERLDDVLHMVRQDRQDLRGWEEPAHLRAVVRRSISEGGSGYESTESTQVSIADPEFARAAGEPDRGQQREGIGQLLEAGAQGLERLTQERQPQLSSAERYAASGRSTGSPALWRNSEFLLDKANDVVIIPLHGSGLNKQDS